MIIKSSEKKEKNIVELIVEVNAEEFDSAINEVFRKNRNQIAVPGFRKGKAPRKIVERMYGVSVFHSDALDNMLPSVLAFATKESELNSVGYPKIIDVDIKEGNSGVDVTINFAQYPEATLGEYKGITAVKPVFEVTDNEIDSEIAGIRLRNARIEKADRPAINGDTTIIDYEGFVDGEPFEGGKGEDHELVLGSGAFIPGFEEKMHGMIVGEQRDLDLVFPENYVENLAGKEVIFKVTLKELREKILPDLDDEFAKDISEFDTLDEYKASIRERILASKEAEADTAFENALMETIIETLDVEIPDAMLEEQYDNAIDNFTRQVNAFGMDPTYYLQMMNMTPQDFQENMKKMSEKQLRTMLALEKIADLEGIEVSDEDIENEYKDAAERYGMEAEDLKDSVSAETIKREIKCKRAAVIVKDNAIAIPPADDDETSESVETVGGEEKKKKTPVKKASAKKSSVSAAATEIVANADDTGSESSGDTTDTVVDVTDVTETETKTTQKKPTTRKSTKKEQSDAKSDNAETEVAEEPKPATKKTGKTKTESTPAEDE